MIDHYSDNELPNLFHEARKEHQCTECRRAIPVGEMYERVRGVWGGEPHTFKTCVRCLALRDYVSARVPEFVWNYGQMRGDALEILRWALKFPAPGSIH